MHFILPAYTNVPALRKLYRTETTIRRIKTPKGIRPDYNYYSCTTFGTLNEKLTFLQDIRLLQGRVISEY